MRISFQQMQAEFSRIFQEAGMPTEPAETCARIHTESSRDGIHTHGAGRVLRFHGHLKAGFIDPSATPTLHKNFGALEVWDGNFGPGILNAIYCTDRAVALAKQNGIGLVGLRNTTHWMRGGTYGLQAAAEGCALIAWTNADGSMPPWGGREARLGNNPFVMALPGVEAPLLLDISMSIYSYGKMSSVRMAGKQLDYPGGFDKDGNLTTDPGAIEACRRPLPIGYWKGSAFAFMLDLLAAVFSDGNLTLEVDKRNKDGGGCSQVFIAIDPEKLTSTAYMNELEQLAKAHIKTSAPAEGGGDIRSPGEGCAAARKDSEENGIWIDDALWAEICAL